MKLTTTSQASRRGYWIEREDDYSQQDKGETVPRLHIGGKVRDKLNTGSSTNSEPADTYSQRGLQDKNSHKLDLDFPADTHIYHELRRKIWQSPIYSVGVENGS